MRVRKKVTIKDVAQKARVVPSTVSRVINNNGYVSDEVRARVLGAIEQLNFEPSPLAKALGGGQTYTIGLILPDIANIFFPSIARGIEDVANVHGYTVILGNADNIAAIEDDYIKTFSQRLVDGIIIAGSSSKCSGVQELVNKEIPVVLIDRRVEGVAVDSVFCDNKSGACAAVSYLLEMGHREIAFLGGPAEISTTQEREEGYLLAHLKKGVSVDSGLIRYGEFNYESGFSKITEILEEGRRPSAVFAANDMIAIGANRAVEAKNLKIPQDISIVGYDDILWAALEKPPLTTVAQPMYRMGMAACEVLLERIGSSAIKEPRQIIFTPKLVIRQSTDRVGC